MTGIAQSMIGIVQLITGLVLNIEWIECLMQCTLNLVAASIKVYSKYRNNYVESD